VLAALKAAHLAGVLHRDVKPGNVLLADDGRVVLTDFGLAIFEGGDGAVTRPGLILGSPQYISPERAREGISGAEADLWSLGATLYAAVEGRSPYARSTTFATLTALATEDPDPAHRAGVLKPVLNALLRKDPRARAGVAETERLLRRAANGEGRVWPWALPRQRKSREIISGGVVRSVGGSGPDSGLAAAVSSVSAAPSKAPPPVDAESMARVNENDSESVSQIGTTNARPNVTFPGKARGKATVPGIPTSPAPAGHAVPPVGGWGSTPPAAPSRPRRRRRLLVGLAALVVLGLLAGLLLVYDRKPTRPTAGAPSSPSAVSPSPSQSEQFGLLPGFSYYTDPTYKWRIAKPNGWTPRTDPAHPTMIFFDEPVLPHRTLGVDRITAPNTDPVAAFKAEATTRSTDGTMPGYKQVRIDPVPGLFNGAADWVYSYNTADGRMQVCERGLVISKQLGYSIYWATPADQWKQNADNWNMISISFTPEPTAS
jgi:eukaryotic-like serine/threonine-protein kinase